MTKSEFISLSLDKQETFINAGGIISVDESLPSTGSQVGEVTHRPQLVSGFSNTQPDSILECVISRENIEPAGSSLSQAISPEKEQNKVVLPQTNVVSQNIISTGPDICDGLMIADSVDLLYLVDDEIQKGEKNGGVNLASWQIQIMLDFADGRHNQDHPFQAVVRACNGSGKDKYVIAACAVWLCMRYKNTLCPITSSSGFQLDNQTCKHTKRLCEAVNRFFGVELWECKYRNYTFRFDKNDHEFDSQIVCYATDEAGKAEGFHPTVKGRRMGIFASEDKTIPDEINAALNKCTGYTHRVHASTPGKSYGHFYDYCQMAVNRKVIKDVKSIDPSDWLQYHVTGAMCPYRGKNARKLAIMNTPGGENSSAFKSQEDAEFGNDEGEMVAIPYTYVWQACRNTSNTNWACEDYNSAGVDLSDGGDETSLAVRNGNKLLCVVPFKFDNTEDTIAFLIEKFKEYSLDNSKSRINGDCIGIGKPILDRLKRLGWKNIRYFDSRASAYNPGVYKNRNSESWFKFRRLLEQNEIILIQDKVLEKQLGTRHYKLVDGKIHQMLSKIEEKKLGHSSPDRADSVLYAFWDYESLFVEEEIKEENLPFKYTESEVDALKADFDMRIWAKGQMNKNTRHSEIDDLNELREELAVANQRRKLINNN